MAIVGIEEFSLYLCWRKAVCLDAMFGDVAVILNGGSSF